MNALWESGIYVVKILKVAFCSLAINMGFGAYYLVLGFYTRSWWLITLGSYYCVLSILRFYVLVKKKNQDLMVRPVGILMMILSLPLAGTVILAVVKDRGQRLHEILMIAMAVYAFAKITLAIINLTKARKRNSPKRLMLRHIALADACVSIFALQRSMLVSFGDMKEAEVMLFNILTGTAVWLVVLIVGINLICGKKFHTAKSKIAKASMKILYTVIVCYKTAKGRVIAGYKKTVAEAKAKKRNDKK